MTDTIEQKALALVNEVLAENGLRNTPFTRLPTAVNNLVLLRAIEQHEAFRQEVSDAVVEFRNEWLQATPSRQWFQAKFTRFIIAKPDPLAEVLDEALWEVCNVKLTDRELQAVLLRLNAKRGGKIEGEG